MLPLLLISIRALKYFGKIKYLYIKSLKITSLDPNFWLQSTYTIAGNISLICMKVEIE